MMAKGEDLPEDRPAGLAAILLSALLGALALAGLGTAAAVVVVWFSTSHFPWGTPGAWRTVGVLGVALMIGFAALLGGIKLRPWRGRGGPVSPATRRTGKLYWAKELLGLVAILALVFGAFHVDQPFAAFSNSALPVWIALVVIPCWLAARLIREGWRNSADEHERHASDFGRNAATGAFLAVTPAWWIAARAGLAPQPDAMVLWILTMLVSSIGWVWRRNA
jgi:hypothetical protein